MGGGGYPRCRWWRRHWLPGVDADVALIRRLVVTESGSRQRGRNRAGARSSWEARAMLARHATLVAERAANPLWNQARGAAPRRVHRQPHPV